MLTYKKSGVDIDKAEKLVQHLKQNNPDIGGFGGAFPLRNLVHDMKEPLLISGSDGVGTKILIAREMNHYFDLGIDLVAMSVNDIITSGATPLFFLDYLAVGKINPHKDISILDGIIEGCRQAQCLLLGGETAELPGMYSSEDIDLAGFAVGLVDKKDLITGQNICAGDVIIGIPSSGLHSNGFSLIRQIIKKQQLSLLNTLLSDGTSLGNTLLKPTRIYASLLQKAFSIKIFKGLAHITGGGIPGNLVRILPQYTSAHIQKNNWPVDTLFSFIREQGEISEEEMFRVFNMGIGMIGVLSRESLTRLETLFSSSNEQFFKLGYIESNSSSSPAVHIS